MKIEIWILENFIHMKKLDEICTTEQQDIALKKYLKRCFEFDMEISEENFRYYYSCYCYENNYFNDLK